MSDHVARLSHDEEPIAGTSSQVHHSKWMSHWTKSTSNPASAVNNSTLISDKDRDVDRKSCWAQDKLIMEDGIPKSRKKPSVDDEEIVTRMISETKKTVSIHEKNENSSFPPLGLCQNKENTSALKTQMDHEFVHKNISLTSAFDREDTAKDFELMCKNNLRGSEKQLSDSYKEQEGIAISRSDESKKRGLTSCIPPDQANHADASGPIVVFERQFSNDNFMCLDQGHRKYQKFSTFLFHEKMDNHLRHELQQDDALHMQDDPSMTKNFFPFFFKKQSRSVKGQSTSGLFPCRRSLSDIDQQKWYQGCRPLDGVPYSVHNVETMRICTMVDSLEKSPGGHPKISQRAHHILFTKETCVNLSEGCEAFREPTLSTHCKEKKFGGSFSSSPNTDSSHPLGLRIQPLWTTTDSSEKENTGNHLTTKVDLSNDCSVEADAMQIDAPKNQQIPLGMASSSLKKDDVVNENVLPDAFDSSGDRARSKRPIAEIPDINEELPGPQPAGSSTDSMEPSTSRVHSLNANHLFPCGEQTSRAKFNVRQDPPVPFETSSRWIKRLKLSSTDSFGVGTKSSEMGEPSSHKKFSGFFNKITKCNRSNLDSMLNNQRGKQQMPLVQNLESQRNSGCSSSLEKRNKSLVPHCSWIQRWRQHSAAATPPLRNPEPAVICEPRSLKLGQDEVGKKQFPSIAAMALMGKAMSGFHPCEFSKRGPVVVWSTKDY